MDLGDRIKKYESMTVTRLIPKMAAIIRLDGKAFHTLTKGMDRPWDGNFVASMQLTAYHLCAGIQGAVFGYVQSDEISILLIDWKKYNSTHYFDGKIQKICSVSASMATAFFNEEIQKDYPKKRGMFDSRVFNIPKHEIINYFIWRQQDASRNSVQMLARSYFSDKQCFKKSCSDLQDMLMEKGVNWNDTPTTLKRGTAIIKDSKGWKIDNEMPILTQDRKYIKIPELFEGEKTV